VTDKPPSERILPTPPPTIYTYSASCPFCGFKQEYHTHTKPEHGHYSMVCAECVRMDVHEKRTDTGIY
jgi:transcription elongation factor Elf1